MVIQVIGFHFVGPNAGEVTQGFALAVRLGAKKSDFNKLVSRACVCGGLPESAAICFRWIVSHTREFRAGPVLPAVGIDALPPLMVGCASSATGACWLVGCLVAWSGRGPGR